MLTSEQCRIARTGLKISQRDLAELVLVSTPTIASFEMGKRIPVRSTLAALKHLFEERGVVFTDTYVNVPLLECQADPTPQT